MVSDFSHEEILRYSRQLLIPNVGLNGQRKIKAASVLIIGTGGLGSPAALYLAATGVGHIGLIDQDIVETSNLQRQVLYGNSSLGKNKVEIARQRLLDLNPNVHVDIYNEPFIPLNAKRIAQEYDIILDASDNFPTRYLSNDLCVLTGKPNIYGAVFRFDGQVSVFDARRGPCYRCLFAAPPPIELTPSCGDGGIIGILPGTIGTLQATEALKLILGIGDPLIGRLLLYNALDLTFDYVTLHKNPKCKICGTEPTINDLQDYEAFCGISVDNHVADEMEKSHEISPQELLQHLRAKDHIQLLDVREPHEVEISAIADSKLIPLGQLGTRFNELDRSGEIIVLCRNGIRAKQGLNLLLSLGFHKVKVLRGGINRWATEIDPNLPIY